MIHQILGFSVSAHVAKHFCYEASQRKPPLRIQGNDDKQTDKHSTDKQTENGGVFFTGVRQKKN
jgi:hypothetical protein